MTWLGPWVVGVVGLVEWLDVLQFSSSPSVHALRTVTWVRIPGPMALVPLGHIQVKPIKIMAQEGADGRLVRIKKLYCKLT
jgi:hypothetical protein